MNARLHEVATERKREEGETREEGGNIILGDGHQQRGRCSDLPDDWIDKVSDYTGVNAHHMARENEIDFPSRELLKPPLPPSSYGPAIAFNNVLPDTIVVPSPSITSHVGDNARSRACDIETTSCSTMRFPYAPGATCNVACSNAPATCNVAPASADCDDPETTWFRNEDHLAEPQSGICTANTTSKICQLGPIDVEDLAMYFDSPTDGCKPPSLGNRAIYSKKSRYGQVARMDQSQEHHRDLNFRDLPSCDLTSNNLQTCNMGPNTLGYCDMGNNDLRLRNSGYDGPPSFCDPRLSDSRFCDMRLSEEQPRESGRHNLGLGDWFCSEERWLQCPASDRCPLYDISYAYDVPVLPPCMYENGYNDNWHYDNAEDEQLLENYL